MNSDATTTAAPVQPFVIQPFYDQGGITIYNADCRKVLPWLGRFDLLLTDPPYGLGKRLTGGNGEWEKHFKESPDWDAATPSQWVIDSQIELAENAIIWGGNYFAVKPSRCWLTWDKVQEFSGSDFEAAWTTLDKPCKTFRLSRVEAHTNGKHHPTEKPLRLIQWCLSMVNDVTSVVDPFMGAGTTLVAAKLAGMRAVGIEINEEYCQKAVERLRQGVLPFAG
jgi:hypothetical protein